MQNLPNMPLPGPPGIPGIPGIPGAAPPPPMREKAVHPDLSNAEAEYTSGQDVNTVLDVLPGKLKAGLSAIESELKRLKNNLAVVQRHEKEINGDEALVHYEQAEVDTAEKYNHTLSLRENLYQQILSIDQVIQGILNELRGGQDMDHSGWRRTHGKPRTNRPAQAKTSPKKNSQVKRTAPRKTPAKKSTKSKKESEGLSDKAIAQHAVANLSLNPAIVNKFP